MVSEQWGEAGARSPRSADSEQLCGIRATHKKRAAVSGGF
jgi:hypothetical protein